jgi:hypothetical protein
MTVEEQAGQLRARFELLATACTPLEENPARSGVWWGCVVGIEYGAAVEAAAMLVRELGETAEAGQLAENDVTRELMASVNRFVALLIDSMTHVRAGLSECERVLAETERA